MNIRRLLIIASATGLIISMAGCSADSAEIRETDKIVEETTEAETHDFSHIGDDYILSMPIYGITEYSSDVGNPHYFDDLKFDAQGHLISYNESQGRGNKKGRAYTHINEYDEKGRRIKKTKEHPLYGYTTVFAYNDTDQMISSARTGYNDNVCTYTYDENGMLASWRTDARDNVYLTEYEYEYDDLGRVVKERTYSTDNGGPKYLDGEVKYEYNEANQVEREISSNYNEDGSPRNGYDTKMMYDTYGHIIYYGSQETYNDDGDELFSVVYNFKPGVVDEYKLQMSETDELKPAKEWISFEENKEIPAPDSIMPEWFTCETSDQGSYRYALPADVYDPKCLNMADRITLIGYDEGPFAYSAQPNANRAIWSYEAVLNQLLGFEINDLGDNIYAVTKDGVSVATISYEQQDGGLYMSVVF